MNGFGMAASGEKQSFDLVALTDPVYGQFLREASVVITPEARRMISLISEGQSPG
jgi:hypothetical protein